MHEMKDERESELHANQAGFLVHHNLVDSEALTMSLQTESKGYASRGRSNLTCTYCKKVEHHRNKCWSPTWKANKQWREIMKRRKLQ